MRERPEQRKSSGSESGGDERSQSTRTGPEGEGECEAGEGKRRGMGRLAVLPARAGPEGVYGARNVTAKVDK